MVREDAVGWHFPWSYQPSRMGKHQLLAEYRGKDDDGQCYNVPGFHVLPLAK